VGVLAFVVGVAAAYGALVFRVGVGEIQRLGFGFSLEEIMLDTGGLPWWQVVAVPAGGGLLVGLILHFIHRGGRAHGIAHVIEASALGGCRMSLKERIVSTVIHISSLGFGASTGREGPVVRLWAPGFPNVWGSTGCSRARCSPAASPPRRVRYSTHRSPVRFSRSR
jgi:CIC family chloride channel protein